MLLLDFECEQRRLYCRTLFTNHCYEHGTIPANVTEDGNKYVGRV
jgi:hypothetical protein